jgi:hypothetical protein
MEHWSSGVLVSERSIAITLILQLCSRGTQRSCVETSTIDNEEKNRGVC